MALISISIGTNVTPEYHLRTAVHILRPYFSNILVSEVYQSEPVNFGGENFLNICIGGHCNLSLSQVIELLKSIENQYKRSRTHINKSKITLDLDLLFYDALVITEPLVLPRQEILNNAFVLQPLADIFPDLRHPINQQNYQALWQSFNKDSQKLWKIDFKWLIAHQNKLN